MQDPLATDPHFLFGAAWFQEHSSLAVISSPLFKDFKADMSKF